MKTIVQVDMNAVDILLYVEYTTELRTHDTNYILRIQTSQGMPELQPVA